MKRYVPFAAVLLLAFTLLPQNLLAQVEYDNDGLLAWLNEFGRIRIYSPGVEGTQQVERISALIGGAQDQVFDYQKDADNEVAEQIVASPALSDWELSVSTNNAYSNLPPNFRVDINIYGWATVPYVLVKFNVVNNEAEAIDAYLGTSFIPALGGIYGGEVVTYDGVTNTILITREGTDMVIGVQPLSHDLVTLKSIDWYEDYYANDSDLYGWLTTGTVEETFDQCPNGPVSFFGFGTANIPAAGNHSFWMTVALGADAEAVGASILDAAANYATILTSVEQIDAVPTEYSLSQNYPNPFNPTTKINFSIPQSEFVTLKVYNSLGEEVADLVNEELDAGTYAVDFNAENLASGFYMYQLTSGSFTLTKKMMLVK